jgi:transposase
MSTLIISEESRVKAANWCVERPRDLLVAKEFGLRDSVPRRWIDKLRREMASADEAPELPRLRQENERLRARHFRSWNTNMSSPSSRTTREPSGAADLHHARGLGGGLLCLAPPSEQAVTAFMGPCDDRALAPVAAESSGRLRRNGIRAITGNQW